MGFIGDFLNTSKGAPIQVDPSLDRRVQQAAGQTNQGIKYDTKAFVDALAAQNGIQNQSDIYNQLGQVAAGQGPNPAQAMLANATGQNVANQAALMAGQRGAGANVGLIARQAGNVGANAQQQAAGQGAALQAQQSLGALGQQADISGQQVVNRQNALNSYNQANLQQQQNLLSAQNAYNQAMMGNQAQVNQGASQAMGAVLSGASAVGAGFAGAPAGKAHGGIITAPSDGPRSKTAHIMMAKGGVVPAMVSPGEAYIPPSQVAAVASGQKSPREAGEIIPGQAKVKGDSRKNDTVPKNLEVGGVVVPRTKMKSDDAASNFVAAVMSKSRMKK